MEYNSTNLETFTAWLRLFKNYLYNLIYRFLYVF